MSNPLEQISRTLPQILMRAAQDAAANAIELVKARVKTGASADGSGFSTPYSKSHKIRRDQRGLQTSRKDLHFSGTMFGNLTEVSKTSTQTTATVTVAFKGQAYRRNDQKGASNQQVAEWLSDDSHENKNIIALSEREKQQITDAMARSLIGTIDNIQIND